MFITIIYIKLIKCAYSRDGWMADRGPSMARSTSGGTQTGKNMDMVATKRLFVKFEPGHGKSIAIDKIKF
jgi:hypothetical protein